MSGLAQFRLPDLGEGLTECDIIRWLVKPGDVVQVNQPIVEVETAKAAVEVPSPYAGTIATLHYAAGETAEVGSPLVDFTVDSTDAEPAPGSTGLEQAGAPTSPEVGQAAMSRAFNTVSGASAHDEAPAEESNSILVGYGPKASSPKRRARKNNAFTQDAAFHDSRATDRIALAKPPVRRFAKDLGIDLQVVPGTGPAGTITRDDVAAAAHVSGSPISPAKFGRGDRRIPVKGVRKHTAAAVTSSAFTAPHVTEFIAVDMTALLVMRDQVSALPEFADVKVSPLLFVAKAMVIATQRHPMINSSWLEDSQEILMKQAINLGIAVASERGLVVPNIKDAGQLSLHDLALALDNLTRQARAGKSTPDDLSNGTITITNIGVFGVDAGTPILNPGEAAILGFGAIRSMPWVVNDAVVPRQISQLSLSFDHRIVDGELGSRFLVDVAALLSDPTLFVAWG